MSRVRLARVQRLTLLLWTLLLSAGCAGPELQRPHAGRCAAPDVRHWAALASSSLQVAKFVARPLYDLDGAGGALHLPPVTCVDCWAVVSYPDPLRHAGGEPGFARLKNRSFTYDNALVALVRLSEGRVAEARQLLSTLAALQRTDGGWGFSFNITGDGFYNAGYVRAGVVSWVLYAMARYTEVTKDRRYIAAMRRAGLWLLAHRAPTTGLILGGRGRWLDAGARYEPGYVAPWASTEHNVDAWFAVRLAAHVDPAGRWPLLKPLGAAIQQHLWLDSEGRYARGVTGTTHDRVAALDAAGTWSALFTIAAGQPARAVRAIAFVDDRLGFQEGGWQAHRPDDERGDRLWFVEASVARGMTLARLGQVRRARESLTQLAQWACARGLPLAYSDRWAQDFPLTPAAAPTAWFVLAAREVAQQQPAFLWRRRLP